MAQKLKAYLDNLGGWETLDNRAQDFMTRVHESWDEKIIAEIEKSVSEGTAELDLASIIGKVLGGNNPFVEAQAEKKAEAASDAPQNQQEPTLKGEVVESKTEKPDPKPEPQKVVDHEEKQPAKQKRSKKEGRFSGVSNAFGGVAEKVKGMFSGGEGVSKNVVLYVVAVIAALGLGAYFYLTGNTPDFSGGGGGNGFTFPSFPTPEGVTFDGPSAVNFVLRFTELAVFATIFISLLESMDRHDPLLLDWWWPVVTWAVMIYAGKHGITTTTAFFMGGAIFTLVLGALWSLQELQDSVWDRFDTSGIFCFCFYMILTYHSGWISVPYPSFVPVGVFYAIGALALIKELIRTSQMFLLGIAVAFLGAAAGFFLTFSWVIVSFGLTIAAVYIGAHQEWLPIKGRRTELEKEFAKRLSIRLIKAWDVMFVWWASFILTILVVYGNFPVMYLAR